MTAVTQDTKYRGHVIAADHMGFCHVIYKNYVFHYCGMQSAKKAVDTFLDEGRRFKRPRKMIG